MPASGRGFTLIELLVVIAIIAVLAVVVILTLNPAELLKQSRDANRVSDMVTLANAVNLYNADMAGSRIYSLGSASTAYTSIPDLTATSTAGNQCQGVGLPALSGGSYHCAASSSFRNVDGNGAVPVNFKAISNGSPLGSLPIDPINRSSSNLFYTYQTNGIQFETTALMESDKYQAIAAKDGGSYPDLCEKGSNLTLALADYSGGGGAGASGTISQANIKMSLASNDAFVDFGSAGSLVPYIGSQLTITDSSGHALVGYIKAAGTGETYGGELLPNTAFNSTSSVSAGGANMALVAGGQSGTYLQLTLTSLYGSAWENYTLSTGMAFRSSVYMQKGSETNSLIMFVEDPSWVFLNNTGGQLPSTWTQYTVYATANTSGAFVVKLQGNNSGQTSGFDTASITQVLTPSATGVTIVSTPGGSNYNWASEQSGFNRNDSSGYTYSIVP